MSSDYSETFGFAPSRFAAVVLPSTGARWKRWDQSGEVVEVTCGGRIIAWQADGAEVPETFPLSNFLNQFTYES